MDCRMIHNKLKRGPAGSLRRMLKSTCRREARSRATLGHIALSGMVQALCERPGAKCTTHEHMRRRSEHGAEQVEGRVPRLSMDYLFMRREDEESKNNPILAVVQEWMSQ